MKVAENKETKTNFIFRGMICYYGRHYWAYFYSESFDTWFQFDDEHLRKIGNFSQVIEKSMKGKAIPRVLFYEREDILDKMLLKNGVQRETR
jgi:ubiquitin C-terminal hydrolase